MQSFQFLFSMKKSESLAPLVLKKKKKKSTTKNKELIVYILKLSFPFAQQ